MSRTALVAGATGLVGALLLRKLAASPEYREVRVIARKPPNYQAGTIRFVHSDLTRLEDMTDVLNVDDVYCCLGTTLKKAGSLEAFTKVDYDMVVGLARAASKAGAKRFLVVSAAGTSAASPAPYSRVKAAMEKTVSDIPFEAVHILRPSLILGARAERRPAEQAAQILAPLLSPLLVGPLKKYRPISGEAIADAMIALAARNTRGVHVHHLPLE